MQEVIEGLTASLEAEEAKGVGFDRSTPRLVEPASEDDLQQLFLDRNWTDKLPIVLPTEARVEEMLRHTSHRPDEVVGHMRPTGFREYWEYTRREGGRQRRDGRLPPGVLPGGAGSRRHRRQRPRAPPPAPPPPWPSSTAPCGTRSG